jgi:hypothetical protein
VKRSGASGRGEKDGGEGREVAEVVPRDGFDDGGVARNVLVDDDVPESRESTKPARQIGGDASVRGEPVEGTLLRVREPEPVGCNPSRGARLCSALRTVCRTSVPMRGPPVGVRGTSSIRVPVDIRSRLVWKAAA